MLGHQQECFGKLIILFLISKVMQRCSGDLKCASINIFCYCCNIYRKSRRERLLLCVERRLRKICGNRVISVISFERNSWLKYFTFDSSYINHMYRPHAWDGRLHSSLNGKENVQKNVHTRKRREEKKTEEGGCVDYKVWRLHITE